MKTFHFCVTHKVYICGNSKCLNLHNQQCIGVPNAAEFEIDEDQREAKCSSKKSKFAKDRVANGEALFVGH